MRQHTAPRCYLRRLAPSVRPPQPPKISFRYCNFSNCLSSFSCNLLRGQKVAPKSAAVKRFRGRSCDCAKSDAFGTFEAIKRSPIFNASSLRPPLVRNRSCRGFGCRVCISLKTYLRRLRGSHRRCEPPKIAPLCGALTRVYFCDSASCAGRSLAPAAAISGPNFVMNCGYIARGPYGRRRARRSNAGP